MDKEGALAAVAILVLAGVLVFAYKSATTSNSINKGQATAMSNASLSSHDVLAAELIAGGPAQGFNVGPAIYVASTPYLFNAPIGNVIPNSTPSNTSIGAVAVDASPYNTYGA